MHNIGIIQMIHSNQNQNQNSFYCQVYLHTQEIALVWLVHKNNNQTYNNHIYSENNKNNKLWARAGMNKSSPNLCVLLFFCCLLAVDKPLLFTLPSPNGGSNIYYL